MIECLCSLWLSVASYHTNPDTDYNEVNPGLLVQGEKYVYGAYYNSHHRWTGLLAYRHNLVKRGEFEVSAVAGLVSGYDFPIAAAVQVRVGQLGLWLVPPTKRNSGVIGFTWQLR